MSAASIAVPGPWRTVVAVVFAASLVSCSRDAEEQPVADAAVTAIPIASRAVQRTEIRTVNPAFRLPAEIEALQRAAIKPQVSARLKANHFVAGDNVAEGDLLVELDDTESKVALDSSRAALEAAKANLTQAESQWQRAEELLPKGFLSQSDYDQAKAAVETARAALSQANANLEQAELNLTYTQIRAPFAGKISKPGHAVGDLVSPRSTRPLFELVQLDPIYATAGVELSVYNKFQMLRQKLTQEGRDIPELTVTLELVGGETYPHAGRFIGWDHQSQDARGTIAGRSEFPNPDGLLLPEQTVVLHGRAIETVERIFLPQKAVMQDQQGHFVMILDDTKTIRRKNIEVGIRDGAEWAVRSGLSEGELVIIEGAERMIPGRKAAFTD